MQLPVLGAAQLTNGLGAPSRRRGPMGAIYVRDTVSCFVGAGWCSVKVLITGAVKQLRVW